MKSFICFSPRAREWCITLYYFWVIEWGTELEFHRMRRVQSYEHMSLIWTQPNVGLGNSRFCKAHFQIRGLLHKLVGLHNITTRHSHNHVLQYPPAHSNYWWDVTSPPSFDIWSLMQKVIWEKGMHKVQRTPFFGYYCQPPSVGDRMSEACFTELFASFTSWETPNLWNPRLGAWDGCLPFSYSIL